MPTPPLKDEMVLNVDGIITVDPGLALRQKAQAFISARKWSTASIYYGDKPEAEFSKENGKPMWSMRFCLGLDHVRKTEADWFADVAAIVEFLQPIARAIGCEFTVEFRLKSRLWYSETLTVVSDQPENEDDLASIRAMLEHFIKPKRDDKFFAKWGHERVFGRNRFILVEGVLWCGFTAAFCLGVIFGYGLKAQFSLLRCVLGVVAGLALGYGIGKWRWSRSERRFRDLVWKLKQPTKNNDPQTELEE